MDHFTVGWKLAGTPRTLPDLDILCQNGKTQDLQVFYPTGMKSPESLAEQLNNFKGERQLSAKSSLTLVLRMLGRS